MFARKRASWAEAELEVVQDGTGKRDGTARGGS